MCLSAIRASVRSAYSASCARRLMTAWLIPPVMKRYSQGLPSWLLIRNAGCGRDADLRPCAALFALIVGPSSCACRVNRSLDRHLRTARVVNNVYSTGLGDGGQALSSHAGHHGLSGTDGSARLAIAIAYLYAVSRSGLALRSTRSEVVGSSASEIDIGARG